MYILNFICLFIEAAKKENLHIENVFGRACFPIKPYLINKIIVKIYCCLVENYFIFEYLIKSLHLNQFWIFVFLKFIDFDLFFNHFLSYLKFLKVDLGSLLTYQASQYLSSAHQKNCFSFYLFFIHLKMSQWSY